MTEKLFTSWHLLLFYWREFWLFRSPATRWFLALLFLLPWVSLRRVGYGHMHAPHGLFSRYRARQQARFAGLIQAGHLPAAMSPNGLAAAFAPAADPCAARIHVAADGRLSCKVVAKRGRRHLYYCHRTLDLGRKVARHDYLVIHPRYRGGLDLKHILAASLSLYDQVGLQAIELTAGLSIGGSFWPKLGFVPDAADWPAVIATVKRNYATLPPDEIEAFDRLHDKANALHDLVEQLCDPQRPLNIRQIREIRLPKRAVVTAPAKRRFGLPAKPPPEPLSLGIRLLSGARWHGSLDLLDTPSRQRLERYLKAEH
ncbi:hypothetical protein [Massilia sp. ST3]|uniref:hypothetical protein n=1 Tax=Massilia sp. ST3 TaxID=2824903 RepID=UPI001B824DF9|nr:hypothetical protein [Massilia sp. ST3]MBQ5947759.1 hypothetical protein [Massilia sp. ST3]